MTRRRMLWFGGSFLGSIAHAQPASDWRISTPAERDLDAEAFKGIAPSIPEKFSDVHSAVVVRGGRMLYEFYRDAAPDLLRDVQSVVKSALCALTGVALGQGHIASLDQPVLALLPEWAPANSDARAQAITVRHLLTMTAGFEVKDPTGTAAPGRPQEAWARPLRSAPGEQFAYDNALIPMLATVLEKATGMTTADYARRHLVEPLGMAEPSFTGGLRLRTVDMARLGHLFLQRGAWSGRSIIPASYVLDATRRQNAGGAPVGLPYGYMWWIPPSSDPRPTFLASGFGGQFIWVHPPLDLVIATTATVSMESNRRGHALGLILGPLLAAARQRAA
jgi:CubicO group peptidase (beta-lactamase class C family)